MKTSFLSIVCLLAIATTAVSCDDKPISEAELPKESKDFISKNFAGVNILRTEKEGKGYSVHLANGCELDFDSKGEWTEVDARDGELIPTAFIIPSIVSYVEDTYKGKGINGIERFANGFDVDLAKQDIELIFDKDGKFLRIDR